MSESDPIIILGFIASLLGAHMAYEAALVDACTKIGRILDAGNGDALVVRDAVTPPRSVMLRKVNYALSLCLFVAAYLIAGFSGLALAGALRFLPGILMLPLLSSDRPRKHFSRIIYRSMVNREADYARSGDYQRAIAMRHFRKGFETSPIMGDLLSNR